MQKNNKNNKAAPLRGGFLLTVSDVHFFLFVLQRSCRWIVVPGDIVSWSVSRIRVAATQAFWRMHCSFQPEVDMVEKVSAVGR